MWRNVAPRVAQLSPLERVRLRRIAVRYALHGWEVTPGACLARSRFVCGRAGCPTVGCHPALEEWQQGASADPARVATWWRSRPHGVLLPTGRAFDVLEVSAHLGRQALDTVRTHPAGEGCAGRSW
ncbi:bifunctional DNA primase/polymerase-like protein [Micromonospora olivasterospora]|uniref:Bifunctional DNA primase/polymerase-like protein n=1 Tax=Micromonospora olivasterospora TaxID=1880 RepID=A0A562I4F3_MICOL|nr:bifunctional DNA primase/polymerase-like protein [Micromonospora olivasterospora]